MGPIPNKNKKCSLKKHEEIDAASYYTKCEQKKNVTIFIPSFFIQSMTIF